MLNQIRHGSKEREEEGQILDKTRLQVLQQHLEHTHRLLHTASNRGQILATQERSYGFSATAKYISACLILVTQLFLREQALKGLEEEFVFITQCISMRCVGREGDRIRRCQKSGSEEGRIGEQAAKEENHGVKSRAVAEGEVVLQKRGTEAAGEEGLELGERLVGAGMRHASEQGDDGVLDPRRGQQQVLRQHLHLDDQGALRLQTHHLLRVYPSHIPFTPTASAFVRAVQQLRQQLKAVRNPMQCALAQLHHLRAVVAQPLCKALHAVKEEDVEWSDEQGGVECRVMAVEKEKACERVAEALCVVERGGLRAKEGQKGVDDGYGSASGKNTLRIETVKGLDHEEEAEADGWLGPTLEDGGRLLKHANHFGTR